MNLIDTPFKDLLLVKNSVFEDERGSFFKPFTYELLRSHNVEFKPQEIYYSINRKQVLRGMHFQRPPHDHAKLVWVSQGKILDVVLDLRLNTKTYGKWYTCELDPLSGIALFIPKGFAHGFLSVEDKTIVNYAQTSCYSKEHDSGIFYDSFGFPWPEQNPIVSERDRSFLRFNTFSSEFI